MATVKIENIGQARNAGIKYGVKFPEGKGRPPMLKLRDAIVAAGDTIEPTEYFSGTFAPRVPVAETGKALYELTITDKVVKSVPTLVPGKKDPTKMVKVPKRTEVEETTVVRLNVEEIRKLTAGVGLRGRVSESRVKEAFAKQLKRDVSELDGAKVGRVVEQVNAETRAIKAEKVSKAAKAAPGGDDTTDANDLVSVEIKGLDLPGVNVVASKELASELSSDAA